MTETEKTPYKKFLDKLDNVNLSIEDYRTISLMANDLAGASLERGMNMAKEIYK